MIKNYISNELEISDYSDKEFFDLYTILTLLINQVFSSVGYSILFSFFFL